MSKLQQIIITIPTLTAFIVGTLFIFLHLIFYSIPNFIGINELILRLPDIRYITLIILGLLSISAYLQFLTNKMIITIFQCQKIEIMMYFFNSLCFTYYFSNSFGVLDRRGTLGIIVLTVFFLYYVPNLGFQISQQLEFIEQHVKKKKELIS